MFDKLIIYSKFQFILEMLTLASLTLVCSENEKVFCRLSVWVKFLRKSKNGTKFKELFGANLILKLFFVCQENERSQDVRIEHRFHKNIIGQKGENIRGIRDRFPEVSHVISRSRDCDVARLTRCAFRST